MTLPKNNQVRRLKLYTPHSMQRKMHESRARFRVGSWGRQSGKSTFAINELQSKAWTNPNKTFWFISPTYDQAKVQYRRLTGSLWNVREIMTKKNQSELRVKFINGSQIVFKSGENFDNLRGESLDGCIIDEVRDQHPELWPMVIRPMLATTGGWACFISTPNGFDAFFDIYEFARTDKTGSWEAFQAPSTCNPLITEQELSDAKRTMTEAQYAQEYLAEFRNLTQGRAYYNYTEANESMVSPFYAAGVYHPMLPLLIGLDFNLNPMAWTIGQKKIDEFYWFDEVWLENSNTPDAADVLCDKIVEIMGEERAQKVGIILAGDSTARAGQRAAAGKSDYDILCQKLDLRKIKWINCTPEEGNPLVKDRVNTMNAKMKAADGKISFYIHPIRCPFLRKDLTRVVWKATGEGYALDQKKDPTLTHASDGVGYAIHALSPLKYDESVATLRVIRR